MNDFPPNHILHAILHEYLKGSNLNKTFKDICEIYGKSSVTKLALSDWFERFESGDYSLDLDKTEVENIPLQNGKRLPKYLEVESTDQQSYDDDPVQPILKTPRKAQSSRDMPPKRNKVPKYEKPPAVKKGFKFSDYRKNEFVVGKEIGDGGFGRIYDGTQSNTGDLVAIKMEPDGNGPLFTEMHVYERILKLDRLVKWTNDHHVHFLGLPHYISSGQFLYEAKKLRFLVIPKYAVSVETVRAKSNRITLLNVLRMTKAILYSLAYLHDNEYVHGDVKAGNLMMDNPADFAHVVLIDFGLAKLFKKDTKEKEDKKRAHNGTPLFTSCDAHRGLSPSFRGDLEILAHNMLYWLTGSLPWDTFDEDCERIFEAKKQLIDNMKQRLPRLLNDQNALKLLEKFYSSATKMEYLEKINLAELLKAIEDTERSLSKEASTSSSPTKSRSKTSRAK